jgi:hypothetical protein
MTLDAHPDHNFEVRVVNVWGDPQIHVFKWWCNEPGQKHTLSPVS